MITNSSKTKFNCINTEILFGLYTKNATKCEICALISLSNVGIYRKFFKSNLAKKYIVFDEGFLPIKNLCKEYNVEFIEINSKNITTIFAEKIKKDNMTIDIAIMNPPYGKPQEGTSSNLHYDITSFVKNNKNVKSTICIQPVRLITSTSDKFSAYKEDFNDLISIEEFNSNIFENTNMSNVAVFYWNKSIEHNEISVKFLNSDEEKYTSLFDIDVNFTDFEKNICTILKSKGSINGRLIDWRNFNTNDYKFYCFLNRANGAMSAKFQSTNLVNFGIGDFNEAKNYNENINNKGKYVFGAGSKKYITNLLNAFRRPLLRFTLAKFQDSQCMTTRCYQAIPDIDWVDNKTATDEGILELCGCINKTEQKNIIKYVDDFMTTFDNNIKDKKKQK